MFNKDEVREAKSSYEYKKRKYDKQFDKVKEAAIDLYAAKRQAVNALNDNQIQSDQLTSIDDILRWQNVQQEQGAFRKVEIAAQNQIQDNMDGEESSGVAAGAAAGAGVAAAGLAAPSALLALTTTFGVASTGTAISTLSGAALTNATLAAIGGGSMAAGSSVLGLLGPAGIIIGGGLLVFSGVHASKKNRELAHKYRAAENDLDDAISKNIVIVDQIKKLSSTIESNLDKLVHVDRTNITTTDLLVRMLDVAKNLNTAVTGD